jgi:hypothetical protein
LFIMYDLSDFFIHLEFASFSYSFVR